MTSNTHIIEKLNPQFFWDVDISQISKESASRLIIERIFKLGNLHEINLVIEFYGRDQVVKVLTNLNYFDPKTFNFITKFFKVPDEKFKCHTQKQLKIQHWSS